MNVHTATDAGQQSEVNEDAVLAVPLEEIDGHLLAVADGMGGHRAGDVASRTATVELREVVTRGVADGRTDREALLAEAFEQADREIGLLADSDPAYEGMGTTLVAAIVADGDAVVANVGDSRAYLVGDGAVEQVTVDQTLARELVEEGSLSEAEAENHPQRHVLTQSLGTEGSVEPAFFSVSLDGRGLLLCSDGLTEEVDDGVIGEVVGEASTGEVAVDRLVEKANENGGSDNISVVLDER